MIRRVFIIGVLLALCIALLGCASAPAAPAVAPQSGQANTAAPAAVKSPLPLPPQPTSPPVTPGAPFAWQTAAPALIVAGATLVPTRAPTAGATAAATTAPTTVPPAATKSSAPAAAGVATGKKTEAKFTFSPALATIEDADPLDSAMKTIPGIFECSSSQTSTTVSYDAGLITVDQIMQAFAQQGHPVKPQ